jgi:hypothetical protein
MKMKTGSGARSLARHAAASAAASVDCAATNSANLHYWLGLKAEAALMKSALSPGKPAFA